MGDIAQALEVMGKGMLGIFTALAIVYLFTILLIKIFPEKPQEKEEIE